MGYAPPPATRARSRRCRRHPGHVERTDGRRLPGALPYPKAVRLLDDSLRTGLLTRDWLVDWVAGAGGTHGVRQLRRLLALSSDGAWSAAERLLHDILRQASITGWLANASLRPGPGPRVVVDVWFPAARVAVEVDGRAWHVSAERFQSDRSRQNRLILGGVRVLRFTWDDLTNRASWVALSIQAAVAGATCGQIPQ